ncbi:DUF5680 domain-containing protein [Enterococcus rivorum]|nr:DUF5680 domain-containing protein [Enterococcus rivorum]
MNYYGQVIDNNFKNSFLKEALMHPSFDLPYRGREIYVKEDYTYKMDVSGDFSCFKGSEKIYFKNILTYALSFHGGKIIDKHFD